MVAYAIHTNLALSLMLVIGVCFVPSVVLLKQHSSFILERILDFCSCPAQKGPRNWYWYHLSKNDMSIISGRKKFIAVGWFRGLTICNTYLVK